MKEKTVRYNITLKATPIKGYSKFAPIATVRDFDEAYIIAARLNGRSRIEELYTVEKVVEGK